MLAGRTSRTPGRTSGPLRLWVCLALCLYISEGDFGLTNYPAPVMYPIAVPDMSIIPFLVIVLFSLHCFSSPLLFHNAVNLVTVPEVMRNGWSYSLKQQSFIYRDVLLVALFTLPPLWESKPISVNLSLKPFVVPQLCNFGLPSSIRAHSQAHCPSWDLRSIWNKYFQWLS